MFGSLPATLHSHDDWTGLVHLPEWSAISMPLAPLLGWRKNKPVTLTDLPPGHSCLALSGDGALAVLFDGREGDIVVTLRNLETGQSRLLYQLPTPHPSSYAERGGVVRAAFSPAGDQLALLELQKLYDEDCWHVDVRVVSLDGEREFYSDRFCVGYSGPIPQLSFAPCGPRLYSNLLYTFPILWSPPGDTVGEDGCDGLLKPLTGVTDDEQQG